MSAAKILGEQALEHQLGRLQRAKRDFMAQADRSTGGQIAQAIRAKYGLNQAPARDGSQDDARSTMPQRADTSAGNDGPAVTSPRADSEPTHPADWVTGDEPMTEKQWRFLHARLGDEADPSMTKAEAAMLIEELIHGNGFTDE